MEMRRRKHPEALIQRVVFENPVEFLSQSAKFRVRPELDVKPSARVAWPDATLQCSRIATAFSTSPTAPTSTPPTGGPAVYRQPRQSRRR